MNVINYAVKDLGVKYYIFGQGDNQDLILVFNRHEFAGPEVTPEELAFIKEKTETFLSRIETTFAQVGHALKMAETIISSNLFIYDKDIRESNSP